MSDYWERRAARDMWQYMEDAEKTAEEIKKLYQRGYRYLAEEINQIFERFRDAHNLTDEEARQLLNTMQSPTDLHELKEKEKWQAMTDDKLSEAEKLAKMTKEEKAQYMQQKKEKELSDREAAITRKELMAEAKNTLAGKNLPQELAEVLNYADAESCNKSIAAVEKAFQSAVQAAVEERLKGKDPMKKAPRDAEDALEAQVRSIIVGK